MKLQFKMIGSWLSALLIAVLLSPVQAAPFPPRPADVDALQWSALQASVRATITQQAKLRGSGNGPAENDQHGFAVAIMGDTALVGARYDDIGGNANQGAVYVYLRSAGVWSQQAQLLAADGAAADEFGFSVALSGQTALIGARGVQAGANSSGGAAYVFIRNGSSWTQQARLADLSGSVNTLFGSSVALDGDTALIGAFGDNTFRGAAFVYVRSAGSWTQQAKLVSGNNTMDSFGYAVALSGDTALISVPFDDAGSFFNRGAAYVYVRTAGSWSQQARLIASDAADTDALGLSVALHGNTALLGAPGDDVVGFEDGSVYVFVRSANVWTQQAKLVAADSADGASFGSALALSGETALIGANRSDGVAFDQGSAYVFVRSGANWSQQAKLSDADPSVQENFGGAVALDGDSALVGSSNDDGSFLNQGSATPALRSGASWSAQAKLGIAIDLTTGDQFAAAVALYGDTAAVGVLLDDVGNTVDQGSVYVYQRTANVWRLQARLTASDGAANDYFGTALALHGDTLLVGARSADSPLVNQGSAYVFVRSAGNWSQQAKLLSSDAAASDEFGWAVALEGDTALIGARSGDGSFINQGSVYVFNRTGGNWTQQAELLGADAATNDSFGTAIALSGTTAVIGALTQDGPAGTSNNQGSAYVFVSSGGTWSQQARLFASDAVANDQFGISVAIAGDTVLVGAHLKDGSVLDEGAAYVYVRSAGSWTQQARLGSNDPAASDTFGSAVALDGEIALVGTPLHDTTAFGNQGAAYAFQRSAGSWTLVQRINANDSGDSDRYGHALALSNGTALLGAPRHGGTAPIGNSTEGAAYLYTGLTARDTSTTTITADTPDPSAVGASVTIGVTVTGGSTPPIDGQVVISSNTGQTCTDSSAAAGSGTAALFSCALSFNSTGPRLLSAVYSASANHLGSSSATEPHAVNTTLTVSPPSLPGGALGVPYSQTIGAAGTASSSPYSFAISAGALPSGLTLASNGQLSGTPLAGGTAQFTVTANDSSSMAAGGPFAGDRVYSLYIAPANQAALNIAASSTNIRTAETSQLSSSGGSGSGAVIYQVNSGAAFCSISGDVLTGTAIGNCRVIATKAGDGNYNSISSGSITLKVINNAPSISSQSNQVILEDTPSSNLNFTIGDVESSIEELVVTASSNNQLLVSDASLATGLVGTGATRSLTITPQTQANGLVYIAVRVTDGYSGFTNSLFDLTITAVNDAPDFSVSGDINAANGAIGSYTQSDFVNALSFGPSDEQSTQAVLHYMVSSIADPSGVVTGISLANNGSLNYTLSGLAGTASFSVVLNDNGGTADGGVNQSSPRTFNISVPQASDLEISKTNGGNQLVPNSTTVYELLIANAGPNPVVGARLLDNIPSGLEQVIWTCTPVQLASCPQSSGTGSIDQWVDLPVGGVLRYALSGTVSLEAGSLLSNSASISPPAGTAELDEADNSATDSDLVVPDGLLLDGFESGTPISVPLLDQPR